MTKSRFDNGFVRTLGKRRQFTVLSLLGLTILFAIAFGYFHFKEQQAKRRLAINRAASYDRNIKRYSSLQGPPFVKVVAEDSGEPVPRVVVGMTLIGPDGGDGGFQTYVTAKDGVAPLHFPLTPGRYQFHLNPDPKSRFVYTEWADGEPYILVAADGTTTVPAVRVTVGDRD